VCVVLEEGLQCLRRLELGRELVKLEKTCVLNPID
jgi:hypothetical protein